VQIAAGEKFNPHVTIGVGTEIYLNKMLADVLTSRSVSLPAWQFWDSSEGTEGLGIEVIILASRHCRGRAPGVLQARPSAECAR
jgi:hypothetical protein